MKHVYVYMYLSMKAVKFAVASVEVPLIVLRQDFNLVHLRGRGEREGREGGRGREREREGEGREGGRGREGGGRGRRREGERGRERGPE